MIKHVEFTQTNAQDMHDALRAVLNLLGPVERFDTFGEDAHDVVVAAVRDIESILARVEYDRLRRRHQQSV